MESWRLPEDPKLFTGAYRNLAQELTRVGEAQTSRYASRAPEIQEKLVKCIWFDQHLVPDRLLTVAGCRIEVLSPGWWNVEAGPDFLKAELRVEGGEIARGDVEVHVKSSDWRAHGHHKDHAYDSVVLHVVMWNNDNSEFVITANGQQVPQLEMAAALDGELDSLARELEEELYPQASDGNLGPCGDLLRRERIQPDWIGRFLDIAGDERMLLKAERLEGAVAGTTLDEVFYRELMDALGYKSNRAPFRQLALRLPLSDLRRVTPEGDATAAALTLQAFLLGTAGLLPKDDARLDEESRQYAASLRRRLEPLEAEFSGRSLPASSWNFGRTRPANYPTRRLAGMSYFLAKHLHRGLFRAVLECLEKVDADRSDPVSRVLKSIHALFEQPDETYWARRSTLGGKRLERTYRLIGPERASVIFLNVILPLSLVYSRQHHLDRLESTLHDSYRSLGRTSENSLTRYVAGRLFAEAALAKQVVSSARRQQGLIQLFNDYCGISTSTCERCLLLLAAENVRLQEE